jgi:signal transduction histidine kinase
MTASTRVLAVAFVAVVGAFIGSTVLVQRSSREIEVDAAAISRDTAPSVQILSDLRAEIRELQTRVMRVVAGRGESPDQVAESRRRLDELLERAVALPTDYSEAVMMGKLHTAIRAFDETAERSLEQARGGHLDQARETIRTELRVRGDAAAATAHELVSYNIQEAEQAAQRIETARYRGNRFAWQLDALCALIALFALWLTIRAMRHMQGAQQERHALAQRKAEELEQFAGRVAHDVLSPLSAVHLALIVAERNPPEAHTAFSRARSSLSRVRGIVDGLLEFARAGARPELGARAEVRAVAAGLLDELGPFAAQRHAALRFDDIPDVAVTCSPGVLLSLLGNLLRNGIKYLGRAEVREVSLRIRARRGRVIFEVEDTGPGIPAQLGHRIFEPYVRGPNTSAPGIGLGLATVKRLVDSHGGSLGVRTAARGGAIFWFELDEAGPAAPGTHHGEDRLVSPDLPGLSPSRTSSRTGP